MAWRALRRSPGFTIAAVLLLALGIGGATVIFSVTDAVLLRTLAADHPEQLVRLVELIPGRPPSAQVSWKDFEEWRSHTQSFSAVAAHAEREVSLDDGGTGRKLQADLVDPEYFPLLNARTALGQLPDAGDQVVLSHRFWLSEFHSDPHVPGRVMRVNGHPFVVAGVMPADFNGISLELGAQLYFAMDAAQYLFPGKTPATCCAWEIAARVRSGVAFSLAESESAAAMRQAEIAVATRIKPLSEDDRTGIEHTNYRLQSIERGVSLLRDRFSTGLLVLLGGAVLLLLLACANIAGLMVARASSRERETAVRAALGATGWRLVRHWLAESSLIAMLGGVAGITLAALSLPVVAGRMPPLRDLGATLLPVALNVALNWRAFAFAFVMCAVAALLSGVAPAWAAARTNLTDGLKSTASDPRRARMRAVLTILQVAICTVVLANSALLVATLHALRTSPAGFDRDHVVTFTIASDTPADVALRLEREAAVLPGVKVASLASRGLMRGTGMKTGVGLPGTRNGRDLNASTNAVSASYFETMGIRVVQGRGLRANDAPNARVVNEAFARRFFPGVDPIGRTFGVGFDRIVKPEFEIVGVVTNTRYRSLREPFQPIIYTCFCTQEEAKGQTQFQLEVRTFARPETVIASVETLLHRIGPAASLREVRTLSQDVDDSLWAERTLAGIGSLFALVAAMVACVGLYGLVAYTLVQRRREIGIRMALGAGPGQIAKTALLRVIVLVAAGAACGTVVALWTGRMLSALLWEVAPGDPVVHAATWALMLVTAIGAAALPAWRATRIDPAITLRES